MRSECVRPGSGPILRRKRGFEFWRAVSPSTIAQLRKRLAPSQCDASSCPMGDSASVSAAPHHLQPYVGSSGMMPVHGMVCTSCMALPQLGQAGLSWLRSACIRASCRFFVRRDLTCITKLSKPFLRTFRKATGFGFNPIRHGFPVSILCNCRFEWRRHRSGHICRKSLSP